MMNIEDSFDEWLEEFAGSPHTAQELKALKTRTGAVTSDEVKKLINEVEFLRYLLKTMLEYCESGEKAQTSDKSQENGLFEYIRFIVSARSS